MREGERVWLWPWLITAAWLSSLFTRDQSMTRTTWKSLLFFFFFLMFGSAMFVFRQGHILLLFYANLFSVDLFIWMVLPGLTERPPHIWNIQANVFLKPSFILFLPTFSSIKVNRLMTNTCILCVNGWNNAVNVWRHTKYGKCELKGKTTTNHSLVNEHMA